MNSDAPLAVGGNRLRWAQLPAPIRAEIESRFGAPVVAAQTRDGGFSPSMASVLTLADGSKAFVKACNLQRSEFATPALRREARVLAQLPSQTPAPRLLWAHDDGQWVVLATEAVDGHSPAQPWVKAELATFLGLATRLAEVLTPAPFSAATLADTYAGEFDAWPRVGAEAARVDPWIREHLDKLEAVGAPWREAGAGDALLHGDFRSDNVVLTGESAVAVDWPAVITGAVWIDVLLALPSVAMHGGGDPQDHWAAHPLSRHADPEAVDAILSGAAALFISRSLQPPIPLLPTIRQFQRAQGLQVLAWLAKRRGWSSPVWAP